VSALEPFWPSRRLMAFDEWCCPRPWRAPIRPSRSPYG